MEVSIGERIKLRRLELGLTVDQVAEKLGKNRATVYRYESDEIENLPINILEPLSKILNLTPAYLMGWSEQGKNINLKEIKLIKNYKTLTPAGREALEKTMDNLLEYEAKMKEEMLQAACPLPGASEDDKNKDYDLMMDDSEWED